MSRQALATNCRKSRIEAESERQKEQCQRLHRSACLTCTGVKLPVQDQPDALRLVLALDGRLHSLQGVLKAWEWQLPVRQVRVCATEVCCLRSEGTKDGSAEF